MPALIDQPITRRAHGNIRLHETPNLGVHQTGSSSRPGIGV
jgi:hypothetical protein